MQILYSRLLSIVFIAALGVIVYSNTFLCSFHFDGQSSIINNLALRNFHHLQDIWNVYPCRFITFLTFALDYRCHGLNVGGYHLFNLMVHLGSGILVWWLVLLTFSTPLMKKEEIASHAKIIALLAGLLFVSHPLQTEAVTYIWQRAASIATMFYLGSLCLYIKSRIANEGSWVFYYCASLTAAILAMFTREIAVTLPLMVLLYEFTFFETARLPWKRIFPFLLTLLIIPLTMLLTQSERFQEIKNVISGPGGISPAHYLLTQLRVIVTYIRLAFLPVHQNLDYDYPISKSIFEWPTLFSFLFLTAILLLAKCIFPKYRLLSFSIFWFFLALLPESSFFPRQDVIVEHRLYLPLVGYCLFLVSGVYYLGGKNNIKLMVALLSILIACNAVLTYQRNKVWQNDLTLWSDVIQKSPHKARGYNNLGLFYDEQGHIGKALWDYKKAIQLDPDYAEAYNNRGVIFHELDGLSYALSDFNKAIQIDPNYTEAYINRGLVYCDQGKLPQALSDFDKAIQIDPNATEAYVNRGHVYDKQNKLTQALSDFNKAIQLDPAIPEAYSNRGAIYFKQGNLPQALSDFNKAIQIDPKDITAYNNRAVLYYQLRDYDHSWGDVRHLEALKIFVNLDFIHALQMASGRTH